MAEKVIDVSEFNCATGELIEREFTEEEKNVRLAAIESIAIAKAEYIANQEREQALKNSAKQKLVAGEPLTEEEAAILVI